MEKYALMFSGGKDSFALLQLWHDKWDETLVIWVNSGAAYPETQEMMNKVKKVVPHFLEIKTNQPQQIEMNGYPSDIVPMTYTNIGQSVSGQRQVKIQSAFDCCSANLWQPAANAISLLGIKYVVRGQRKEEMRTSPIQHGEVVNGITYLFPLQDWNEVDVDRYLQVHNIPLPAYYSQGETKSRDCWNCTGYLDEQITRIHNLPELQRNVVLGRLQQIRVAVEHDSKALKSLTKE